jgi:hypothetical protein
MAPDNTAAMGFARSWPAMSGALPWTGSYRLTPVPRLAEGIQVFQRHLGESGRDATDDGPPEFSGREDVRLVHGGQTFPPPPGRLEGHARDALDLDRGIGQGVHRPLAARPRVDPLGLAIVEATGQLSDHEQVHSAEEFGLQRGRARQGRDRFDRAKIGKEVQGLAERQDALLRAHGTRKTVPAGAAGSPEEDGVRLTAQA